MRLRRKLVKGAMDLALGYAGQQLLSLLRNILLARLLSPHDFGAAVTLAIAISAVEMMSDVGVEKFIISAPDGNQSSVQGSLHAFLLVRGVALCAAIFFLADLIAWLFKIPDAAWAYRWLALVPLIRGFTHLDTHRFQRELTYRPNIVVSLAASCGGLVSAVVLAWYLRTFEAMLWSQIAQAAIAVIGSHLAAGRPYTVTISGSLLARLMAYGWPLTVNGAIMFAADQGDRILIGVAFGVNELAVYAIAAIITFGASLFIMRLTGALYLPIMSEVQSQHARLKRRSELTGVFSLLMSTGLAVPLILFGERIVPVVFGSTYDVPRFLIAWLAVAASAMVLRSSLIAAALASGHTKIILFANCFKFAGLGLAAAAIHQGYGPVGVAVSVAIGQILTTTYFFLYASESMAVKVANMQDILAFLIICGTSFSISFFWNDILPTSYLVALSGLIVLVSLSYCIAFSLDARRYVKDVFGMGLRFLK
jgi:O-antigen/teichoic acid export membrane protein